MATRQEVEALARKRGLDPHDPSLQALITEPDQPSQQPPDQGKTGDEGYFQSFNPMAPGGMLTREGWNLPGAARYGLRHSTIGELARRGLPPEQDVEAPEDVPSSLPE